MSLNRTTREQDWSIPFVIAGLNHQRYVSKSSHRVQLHPKGFTLIEALVTVLVIGILAALATPSFLSWVANKKVEETLEQLVGAVRETQAEARRKSQGCTVRLDTANKVISAQVTLPSPSPSPLPSPENCLPLGTQQLSQDSELQMTTSFSPNTFNFTYRGTTPQEGIIVIRHRDSNKPRCLVVSAGIGILRTGFYAGDPASAPIIGNCLKNR